MAYKAVELFIDTSTKRRADKDAIQFVTSTDNNAGYPDNWMCLDAKIRV